MSRTRCINNALMLGLLFVGLECAPAVRTTPPPADAPAELVAASGDAVMIGAGDIGSCGSLGDEMTGALVDSVLRADSIAKVEDAVFTLGDNAYTEGTARQFRDCFTPSWGDTAKLIMRKIYPAPGNHEYYTSGAAPYYKYFGERAGTPSQGYYSYDVGAWHIIVLNSEIVVNSGFTAAERKAQEDWLRQDLESHPKTCTMAYWHHPRFSSGWHGTDIRLRPIWQLLYDNGADVVLSGHDHNYERFLPQTPDAVADSAKGITEFVVGTGGEDLRGFGGKVAPNSAYRLEGYFGVLKLTLGSDEYTYAFLDTEGRIWDPGIGKCH